MKRAYNLLMLKKALSTIIHARKYSIRECILAYILVTFTLFGGFSSYTGYRANKNLADEYMQSISESKLENTFLRLRPFVRDNFVSKSAVQDSSELDKFLQSLTTESIAIRHNHNFFIHKGHSFFNQASLSDTVLDAACDGNLHEVSHLDLFITASVYPEFKHICAIYAADINATYHDYFILYIRDNLILIVIILLTSFFVISRILDKRVVIPIRHLFRVIEIVKNTKSKSFIARDWNDLLNSKSFPIEFEPLLELFRPLLLKIDTFYLKQTIISRAMSHEITNPLILIKQDLRMMLRKGEIDSSSYLEISQHVDEAQNIIKQSSQLNKGVESRHYSDSELEPVSIFCLINEIVSKLELHCNNDRHINITKKGEDISQSIFIDLNSLLQSLILVFDNAMKYSPPGTPIELDFEWNLDCFSIYISDYGFGVRLDELDHIFQPFQRGSASQMSHDRERGAGIGLSIAKLLVENDLGGSLDLIQNSKGSTCFKISVSTNHRAISN